MKIIKLAVLLVLAFFIVGCSESEPETPAAPETPSTPEPAQEPKVEPIAEPAVEPEAPSSADIQLLGRGGFDPGEISVSKGAVVTFEIMDKVNHKLSQTGKGTISPLLKPGETFDYKFDEEGEFEIMDQTFKKRLKVTVE